jgi:hypothetical protein
MNILLLIQYCDNLILLLHWQNSAQNKLWCDFCGYRMQKLVKFIEEQQFSMVVTEWPKAYYMPYSFILPRSVKCTKFKNLFPHIMVQHQRGGNTNVTWLDNLLQHSLCPSTGLELGKKEITHTHKKFKCTISQNVHFRTCSDMKYFPGCLFNQKK